MENKYPFSLLTLAALIAAALSIFFMSPQPQNFEECAEEGGSIMESYPRKCRHDGETFVEPSCSDEENVLTLKDAKQIARESECSDRLTGNYSCNNASGTYWLDLGIQKEGCNPACVVDIEHRNATINWRCTGFVPEE